MSSGSYLPPPVRMVEIPKPGGRGVRVLGVPTVADRIAQSDWVIDLDIKAFFDTLDHELVMRTVRKHTDLAWIHLYVQRWLKAPMQREDGAMVARDRGSPQGSAISPLLANLFMHYAFDAWMKREFPQLRFERYCDDLVVHCVSERQARYVRAAIAKRLAECRLEMHPEKTRIVYCKDADRTGSYEHERFDFLGYGFRPRLSKSKHGKHFVNFTPAVSDEAGKAIRKEIRSWKLQERSDKTLGDLARMFNAVVQGWINYYGRFYKSALYASLRPLNEYLARWAERKYKRLRRHQRRARGFIAGVALREPGLFAHWRFGLRPDGWAMGAG
jgi:RNA-directed DNA polymerase